MRGVPAPAAAGALLLAALAAAGTALADPSPSGARPKAKASSFAPHQTKSHVYGTPVSKPILHKRKKRARPAAPAGKPAEPFK